MQSMLKRKPQVCVCVRVCVERKREGGSEDLITFCRLTLSPHFSPQIKTTPIDLTSTTPPPLKTAAIAAEAAIIGDQDGVLGINLEH